jgi:hypothetical protein
VSLREGTINRVFRSTFPEAERSNFRTAVWAYGLPERPEDLHPLHGTLLHAVATAAKLEDSIGITLLPDREGGAEQRISYRGLYHRATSFSVALGSSGSPWSRPTAAAGCASPTESSRR